jgi:hypothetical protein
MPPPSRRRPSSASRARWHPELARRVTLILVLAQHQQRQRARHGTARAKAADRWVVDAGRRYIIAAAVRGKPAGVVLRVALVAPQLIDHLRHAVALRHRHRDDAVVHRVECVIDRQLAIRPAPALRKVLRQVPSPQQHALRPHPRALSAATQRVAAEATAAWRHTERRRYDCDVL